MVPVRQFRFWLFRLIASNDFPPASGLPLPDPLVVMEEDGDRPLFQGLLRDKLDLLLERSLYLLVERLDPVVGVYELPKPRREFAERQYVLRLLRPDGELRALALPFRDERLEGRLPGFRVLLPCYPREILGRLGSIAGPCLRAGVPQ